MKSHLVLLGLFVGLAPAPAAGEAPKRDRAAPPVTAVDTGTKTRVKLTVDGDERVFIVHRPAGYTGTKKVPVVIMFHGSTGSGLKFYNTSRWKELGNTHHFISVYPTAMTVCVSNGTQQKTNTYWMTPIIEVCPNQNRPDDVLFVKKMLEHLRANYAVDDARVYASGFSIGMGFIMMELLVKMPEAFAAVGGAGSVLTPDKVTVSPAIRTTAVSLMMGQEDGHFDGDNALPITLADYNKSDYIDTVEGSMTAFVGVENRFTGKRYPKFFLADYNTAVDGGRQRLRLGVLVGLGHVWPQGRQNDNGLVAAELLWPFFAANPRSLTPKANIPNRPLSGAGQRKRP